MNEGLGELRVSKTLFYVLGWGLEGGGMGRNWELLELVGTFIEVFLIMIMC